MSTIDERGDLPPDAWLAEALRHAPDADARPPQAVSDTILRQARAATAAAATAVTAPSRAHERNALARAWGWLGQPAVAGGFASVVVATLAGVMWWGQPLDGTVQRPAAVAAAGAPADGPSAAAPATTPVAPAGAPSVATRIAPSAAPAAGTQRHGTPARAQSAPTAQDSELTSAPNAALAAAPVAVAPAALPASPPLPAAAPKAASAGARAGTLADSLAPQALARSAAPAPAPALRLQAAPTPQGAPLAALLADIEREPQRWRWQQGSTEPQAMSDALQRWLQQLSRATAGAWAAAAPSAASGPAAGEVAVALRLLRDGEPHTTLRLGASSVWADAAAAPRAQTQTQTQTQTKTQTQTPARSQTQAHAQVQSQALIGQPAVTALTQALAQALSPAPPDRPR